MAYAKDKLSKISSANHPRRLPRPTPRDVLAVLCGPEEVDARGDLSPWTTAVPREAMEEEGEVDLAEYREQAAKDRFGFGAVLEDLNPSKSESKSVFVHPC